MLLHKIASCTSIAVALSITAHTASAQCAHWEPGFDHPYLGSVPPSVADNVLAAEAYDAGGGAALYLAGRFDNWILKWNGSSLSPLGTSVNNEVDALAAYDDGSGNGPALYVGGRFTQASGINANHIARWNGTSWTTLANGIPGAAAYVLALHVFDDGSGSGPSLYAGGFFFNAGSGSAQRIAKWNGSTWSALGSGLTDIVTAMHVFDDGSGSGPALYVGGKFASTFDGLQVNHIAKWNGSSWSALGSGTNGDVLALSSFDDGSGSGPKLYAGGNFTTAGGMSASNIASWNGSAWTSVANGANDDVRALRVLDDGGGDGPALYAGGIFTTAGADAALRIAKWNGSTWSPLAEGIRGGCASNVDNVSVLNAFDDGSGSGIRLFVGGHFDGAGELAASNLAMWNGTLWSTLTSGNGTNGQVRALIEATLSAVGVSSLYAAGEFTNAGASWTGSVARFDGTRWWPLGTGTLFCNTSALAAFDSGSGNELCAAGTDVRRWDGANWSLLGSPNGLVNALGVFDDGGGPSLFATGAFTTIASTSANRIAKWNGSDWSALGSGLPGTGRAMTMFDDGSGGGSKLYVGGELSDLHGFISKWNGTSWSSLPGVINKSVEALAVFDDGSGSGAALYAGGMFTSIGAITHNRIAKWNGTSWSALGTDCNNGVSALTVFDDGSGSALYVAGSFTAANGTQNQRVAQWDGIGWTTLENGLIFNSALAMAAFSDGSDQDPDLYVGGDFLYAGALPSAVPSLNVAKWRGCGAPGSAYCFGDGLDPVVTAMCPCTNFGDPGHGCANSNPALGGARLSATGTTSPNTLLFTCEGIPNNALSTFWRGTANTAGGGVVHDGIQCLGGTTIRFGQQFAGQLGNPPNTISSGTIGLAPGSTRYYQVLYRNPAPGFCPPGTYNFSNGYKVVW